MPGREAPLLLRHPSEARGRFDHGWLDTRHTFSFGDYQDPKHLEFHSLRVLNEDWIQPGGGFDMHPHRDMEILTWVLEGALEHRDSLGNGGVIRPGDLQRMSAGTGIRHSEYNASGRNPVHLLQIWLFPDAKGHAPRYGQATFPLAGRRNRLQLLASGDGRGGSLDIYQDAQLYGLDLEPGAGVVHELATGRAAWIQVATGAAAVNGVDLGPGDGLAVEGESPLRLEGLESAQVLLFDLP